MDSLLQQGREQGWNLNEELKAALVKSPDKALRYDPASSTISYLGISVVGTVTSAAAWQIRRLTFSAAGGVVIEYADGDNNFDNTWDDRASLSYS